MSDKGRGGFVLTPSRLGKPAGAEGNQPTKPIFTGLKQSKLGSVGILANSKLSVLSTQRENEPDEKPAPVPTAKSTFSFTPLTKPASEPESLLPAKENSKEGAKEEGDKGVKAVFGENLSEKVVKPVFGENLSEKAILPEEKEETTESTKLLFSSVSATPKQSEEDQKTLSESAAEYTETHANKRKYDEVTVVTGEEEESNVLQCNVKLYIFDTENKNWMERSRGLLRLNDAPISKPGHIRSRLVMRTSGSLRVVLNTKLWAEMVCEKVNDKNIRISAWDEDVIKIFLITAPQKDAEKLFNALECRISQLKHDRTEEGEPTLKRKPEDLD